MAKCNRQTHPELFGYLEAYGLNHRIIDKIDRIKENDHYAVVGWFERSRVNMLDLSKSPDLSLNKIDMSSFGWNMLNDGMNSVDEKDWNKIQLDPYCDTFYIPEHEEYGN